MYKGQCEDSNAAQVLKWIRERLGVHVWRNQEIGSSVGATALTPVLTSDGTKGGSPGWRYGHAPECCVTDPAEIEVLTFVEATRFHVGTQRGSGLSTDLSWYASRRLQRELEKAGEGSTYMFEYGEQKNCVILRLAGRMSLADWAKARESNNDNDAAMEAGGSNV